ncbi:MAG: phage regulatory CII family protein [Pseudomonadota bacterium]
MNRLIASLHLARRHPDFDVLAAHMGLSADTLRKKLTRVENYNFFVREEELLIELCQSANVPDSLAPLTAAAANAGALLVTMPRTMPEGSPTFKCLADAAQEFGQFMSTAAEALADGKVTANELKAIETQFAELVAMGQTCLANMAAIHEAGKPRHERGVA